MADLTSFEQRILPHLDAAYNLARWLTHDAHDAEDVVQEACIRALRYMKSLESSDARPWFLTIVRNAFYDWIARNRPAEVVQDDGTILEAVEDPAATASARPRISALRIAACCGSMAAGSSAASRIAPSSGTTSAGRLRAIQS